MVSAVDGANTTSFVYGPDGARLKKTTNGTVTLYLGEDVEITSGQYLKYLPGDVKKVGSGGTGTLYWQHRDHLQSVRVVTKADGTKDDGATYRPYGEQQGFAGTTPQTKGYINQRLDGESGLMYLHARYYDPQLGRFIQADASDPTATGVGINRYAYSTNNPVAYLDPSGLYAIQGSKEAKGSSPSSRGDGAMGHIGGIDQGPSDRTTASEIEDTQIAMDDEAGGGSGIAVPGGAVRIGGGSAPSFGGSSEPMPTVEAPEATIEIECPACPNGGYPPGMRPPAGQSVTPGSAAAARGGAGPVLKGQQGEAAVGITPADKVRIPSLTETAKYRVTDKLTQTAIDEIKNVTRLSFSGRVKNQLRDLVEFAKQSVRNVTVRVRPDTNISPAAEKAMKELGITIVRDPRLR